MTALAWDVITDRKFEGGLDRGVLYLPDGSGIAWNGLVSLSEKTDIAIEPLYFDGRKFNDVVTLGDYSAELSAFTYPDEFSQFEGVVNVANGFSLNNQRLKRFGLSYRTKIGDAFQGLSAGYKIHVVYNLLATPSDNEYKTLGENVEPLTFKWTITSVPVDVAGYEPTAQFVLDTTVSPVGLVTAVEEALYGDGTTDARLFPMSYFINLATSDW